MIDGPREPFRQESLASMKFNNSSPAIRTGEKMLQKKLNESDSNLISMAESCSLTQEELREVSETSTNRDVSMVLNHSILSQEDFLVDIKTKRDLHGGVESQMMIQTQRASRDSEHQDADFLQALKRLKQGIAATKFNYSTMGTKKVVLSLSADERYLVYRTTDKSIKSFFSKAKSYPIEKIASFVYGGMTSTFKKHNKRVLKLFQDKNKHKINSSNRSTEKSHSLPIRKTGSIRLASDAPKASCEDLKDGKGGTVEHYPWECISVYR